MSIPSETICIINEWVIEFHRADSASRVRIFQNVWSNEWRDICDDIRMNTPRYSLLFPDSNNSVAVYSIFSPDCNPHEFAYFQDRLSFIRRRALSIREIYRTLI
jgi:hypothetical protein